VPGEQDALQSDVALKMLQMPAEQKADQDKAESRWFSEFLKKVTQSAAETGIVSL